MILAAVGLLLLLLAAPASPTRPPDERQQRHCADCGEGSCTSPWVRSDDDSRLYLMPSSAGCKSLTLDVWTSGACMPVQHVPFHLRYDPAVMSFVGYQAGGAICFDGLVWSEPITLCGTNERGDDLACGVSCLNGTAIPVAQPTRLVSLHFRGRLTAATRMDFAHVSFLNEVGAAVCNPGATGAYVGFQ